MGIGCPWGGRLGVEGGVLYFPRPKGRGSGPTVTRRSDIDVLQGSARMEHKFDSSALAVVHNREPVMMLPKEHPGLDYLSLCFLCCCLPFLLVSMDQYP